MNTFILEESAAKLECVETGEFSPLALEMLTGNSQMLNS